MFVRFEIFANNIENQISIDLFKNLEILMEKLENLMERLDNLMER